MRTITTFLCALAIAAGCAGPTATPTPVPSPAPTAIPTPVPTAPPSASPTAQVPASPTAVSARVTFDGTTCTYTGPTVIPFPASLTIEYAPTPAQEESAVGVIAVRSGTTQAQLEDPANPAVGAGVPDFAYNDTHMFSFGSGTGEYRAVPSGDNPMADPNGPNGKPYDTYIVMCLPSIPGTPVGGYTILHVVGETGAINATASPADPTALTRAPVVHVQPSSAGRPDTYGYGKACGAGGMGCLYNATIVANDERLSGCYILDPSGSTSVGTWGAAAFYSDFACGYAISLPTDKMTWYGEWFAMGVRPIYFTPANADSSASKPGFLPIDSMWLRGRGANEGFSAVLHIEGMAEFDGWIFPTPDA